MADFKTAEQYVVEKLETVEKELEDSKVEHSVEVGNLMYRLNIAESELEDVRKLLNMFRDFIRVRHDSYWGYIVDMDMVYEKQHPEMIASLMEYFDIQTKEDE